MEMVTIDKALYEELTRAKIIVDDLFANCKPSAAGSIYCKLCFVANSELIAALLPERYDAACMIKEGQGDK